MPDLHWLPQEPDWSAHLAALAARSDISWPELVGLAKVNLDFLQTNRLDKLLRRHFAATPPAIGTRPVRLAVLSSSTTDYLLPGLRVAALRRDLWLTDYTPAYGQYLQDLANPASGLHAFAPDTVLCAFDAHHLFGTPAVDLGRAEADRLLEAALERLRQLWRGLREHFGCHIIQQTVLPTAPTLLGGNEHRLSASVAALVRRLNHGLRDAADEAGVDLLALDEQIETHGLDGWHDRRLWLRAKQAIAPPAAPLYGDLVGRLLAARQGRSAKCLVLDLDNTLWGGVIGDDGLENIVIGQGSALGEAHADFQRYALDLSRRGVILAVCSKNDEANAWLPFDTHPDMVLKREHIACLVANWDDKASNLRTIAARLNIGLDALVFADDNPFERHLIRRELPMVAVPEMTQDPAFYTATLAAGGYFEGVGVTREDLDRARQYQANASRDALRGRHTDLAAYLHSLEMTLEWNTLHATELPRVVQLINKTNQFNLTTRRYGEDQIRARMNDPDTLLLHLRLKDSLGDNGIIAVVMAMAETGGGWRIDTWLMSCRVLGREVERATLNLLAEQVALRGGTRLHGLFIPSGKNGMVSTHYAALGFIDAGPGACGHGWTLDLADYAPAAVPMTIKRS
jgi:FkbH-like protein